MLYEYALISVAIACGYWGWFFLRKQPTGTPTYGVMQLGTAALAGLGLWGRHSPNLALGLAGAVGCGAGACLLVIAPLARSLARRFAGLEYLGIAGRLLDLADLLAPGSGAAEEKGVLASMAEIRDGKVEPTVGALTAAKRGASPEARQAIDERIALLYLAAYRWTDAIEHSETSLLPGLTTLTPELVAAAKLAGHRVSLRDELGVAPPVWVELLGAYGRTGNLDQAARMLAKLEDVCATRPDAGLWVHRARLMFLALAGRPAAVRQLVEQNRAQHLSPTARTYWLAVALANHGERDAAQVEYRKARGRSRGKSRDLIDEALAQLHSLAAIELSPLATELVARIEAAPLPAPVKLAHAPAKPWATWTLTALPIVVFVAATVLVGPTAEPGTLVRSGAMVRGFVQAGEWWRLVSAVLVHVGIVHLGVNTIGLWFLGRTTEDMFGPARTVAIFGLAGIAGATASFLAGPAGLSAGASGAIFGLLGAMFIELTWHKDRYRAAWKRGMWGGIIVVTIAQLGVGLVYPVVDRWAHGIGLVGGIVAGVLLSPNAPWRKLGKHLARGLAVALGALTVVTAIFVLRTSTDASFAALPQLRQAVDGVSIVAPTRWAAGNALVDPDGLIVIDVHAEPVRDRSSQEQAWVDHVVKLAASQELPSVTPATSRKYPPAVGWDSQELTSTVDDELGNHQPVRILIATRVVGPTLLELTIIAPASIVAGAPGFLGKLVASVAPQP